MPDAILLDWNMPIMDGLNFLKTLRKEPKGDNPVVVFCTAERDVGKITEALEAGANEYVMKPFDSDIIESKFFMAGLEGYDSLPLMIEELFGSGQTRLAVHVVSALLERDTQFNDEGESLNDIINDVLPILHRLYKGTTLRILSYGCSSGQEPYSIAMAIENNIDLFPGLKYEIVGVDYPSLAIDRARAGRYTHFDVQRGLPIKDLVKFFDRIGEDWVVKKNLRKKVEFTDFHLLSKLNALGEFHLVVFRNRLGRYSAPAQIRAKAFESRA